MREGGAIDADNLHTAAASSTSVSRQDKDINSCLN